MELTTSMFPARCVVICEYHYNESDTTKQTVCHRSPCYLRRRTHTPPWSTFTLSYLVITDLWPAVIELQRAASVVFNRYLLQTGKVTVSVQMTLVTVTVKNDEDKADSTAGGGSDILDHDRPRQQQARVAQRDWRSC